MINKYYLVGERIKFYVPSMGIEEIIEEGVILDDAITVRSLVDGEVYDIIPDDIVGFNKKWKEVIWKSRKPSVLLKTLQKKLRK